MKSIVFIALLVAYVLADGELASMINQQGLSWEAEENHMTRMNRNKAKSMMGTIMPKYTRYTEDEMNTITKFEQDNANDLPEEFDARDKWPKCIHPVRNQEHCGSCWAFAASEAASDRFCIASNGTIDVVLSPQDMVSCSWLNFGCQGGMIANAWIYLWLTGVAPDSCVPYTAGNGTVESCPSNCKDKLTDSVSNRKFHMKYVYPVGTWFNFWNRERLIQKEILSGGSVEAGFTVYEDFLHYKTGVYKYTTGSMLGGHAIKIVGWGVDSKTGLKYWTVVNSWSESWGEKGTFKIQRGTNECGIEGNVMSGVPNVASAPKL
ncbi:cathepsin B [Acrasis kona]|uniref:Cathepsin B n=1 Tax=Acrasis kona TaxID=1008807 RepID=A0AAW2Z083_9EUKA